MNSYCLIEKVGFGIVERIVVTGYGVLAPGAHNRHTFREILEQGICTQEIVDNRGPGGSSIVAGLVHDESINLCKKKYKRYPKSSLMAMVAAEEAIRMAHIKESHLQELSVIIGSSGGALNEIEELAPRGEEYRTYPMHGLAIADAHTISSAVAVYLGAKGQVYTITTGCTSSIDSIQLAMALLQTKQTNRCVVGGTDSTLGRWSSYGFFKIRAVAGNTEIENTGIPFSKNSNGFVLAEGAGMLVLERESDALHRGASIYGVIDKVGSNNNATGLLLSNPSEKAMILALKDTLGDSSPDFISSQALGLSVNDDIERKTYHALFDRTMKITSIKGTIGHTFGATGALQTISALQSIEHGFIPPTLKTDTYGFEDMGIVTQPIYQPINRVAITTHGLGGNNSCLLVSKYSKKTDSK